jgi:hypothetical protein
MDLKDIRKRSSQVEFKAKSDPAFLKRLQEDPVTVLQKEGFDPPTAREVASQLRGDAVSKWCDGVTCIVTSCSFFTANPPERPKPK